MELSSKKGTISYAILSNQEFITNLFNANLPLAQTKSQLIEMLKATTKQNKKRDYILGCMEMCRNNMDLYRYTWNLVLAGDDLKVVA